MDVTSQEKDGVSPSMNGPRGEGVRVSVTLTGAVGEGRGGEEGRRMTDHSMFTTIEIKHTGSFTTNKEATTIKSCLIVYHHTLKSEYVVSKL